MDRWNPGQHAPLKTRTITTSDAALQGMTLLGSQDPMTPEY
ncbi:hypothetical protein AS9A_3468 [Hoyosella subflava DQS3-9A1]|uniref:Uncharacterized protein n=1 Tax=Hoyosella subflava (strain DSM 45089 / JCM 17490 / NBRC 109087 / DQS3-9A1) TaxID=443218 RepID=F6EQN2_HOYSD|nr:hypothetical protein AS9A_3468 [Hoyosella subflava DQS3-9A1]